MCSKNNLEKNIQQDICNNSSLTTKKELRQIYEKVDQLEEKIQNKDLENDLHEQINEYIKKMGKDLTHNLWIKYLTLASLVIYSIILHLSIFSQHVIFSATEEFPYIQFAFTSTTIFSTFFVFSKIIEGTFRTHHERHKHDTLPPNIQKIMELFLQKET